MTGLSSLHACSTEESLCYCSLLDVVSQCIDEDVSIFKSTVQTVVDTLEVGDAASSSSSSCTS